MTSIRVALVQPGTPGTLFEEFGAAAAAGFVEAGADLRIMKDGDPAVADVDIAVLFGECIRLDRSARILRGLGPERPVTVVWQSEPFPPLDAYVTAAPETRERTVDRVLWWIQTKGANVLRPVVPLRARRDLKERIRRVGTRLGDIDGQPRRLKLGVDRFERVAWIEREMKQRWLDHVLVTAPDRVDLLQTQGVEASFLPLGYHPVLGTPGAAQRDLDVVFLGSRKDDRRPVLDKLESELTERGVTLHVEEGPCYGADRIALLQRTKVSLNLLGVERELPRMRMLLSMGSGALVVSESVTDPRPFVPGRHLVTAEPGELVDVITHYVRDDAARGAITSGATELLSSSETMKARAQTIMGLASGAAREGHYDSV